jgi:hypothetical protein
VHGGQDGHGPVVVPVFDNTFASPVLFRPMEH